MPTLTSTDWLILLLYFFSVLAIGFSLRTNIKSSADFLQAGRSLPTWICALAFIAVSLGSQELIAMGAAGAQFGFKTAFFFSLGAIPAMLFAGVYMVPLYYGSGARSVPEYLYLRFDQKTRLLNAVTFVIATVATAGISLYLMARLFQALHIFDPLFFSYGWPRQGIFTFGVLLPAVFVLAYVLFAGLAGAIINQALQFVLIVAGLLPMVLMGLNNIGGWSGLNAALPTAFSQDARALNSHSIVLVFLLGFVLTASHWTTDFRLLQTAMAAKCKESAGRIPLFAAAARLFLPFLLVLPGVIAIALPTPQSTTIIRNENGAIYHEITVVPREAAEGRGLVPARLDPASGNPLVDGAGHTQLNYDRATPSMMAHFLPTGLLGLGLAALLASLMSGLAACVTAFNTVFTYDIYQSCIRKSAEDKHYLTVARWTTLAAILLSIAAAYAVSAFNTTALNSSLAALLLVFSIASAPQLATFLLGMFWRRATAHGAFAGLAAGTATALLHHALTLPIAANPGLQGGWIAIVHRYPGVIAQCFWTATLAIAVNLIVTVVVSVLTPARPAAELKALVHHASPKAKKKPR